MLGSCRLLSIADLIHYTKKAQSWAAAAVKCKAIRCTVLMQWILDRPAHPPMFSHHSQLLINIGQMILIMYTLFFWHIRLTNNELCPDLSFIKHFGISNNVPLLFSLFNFFEGSVKPINWWSFNVEFEIYFQLFRLLCLLAQNLCINTPARQQVISKKAFYVTARKFHIL